MKKILISLLLFSIISCVPITPKPVIIIESSNTPIFMTIQPSKTLIPIPTVTNTITPTITSTSTITPTVRPSATAPTFTPLPSLTVIPSPTRLPFIYNGIRGDLFTLDNPLGVYRNYEDIWFNFKVTNITDKPIHIIGLGAVIKDKISQVSYGDFTLEAGKSLEWKDHFYKEKFNVVGKYEVFLAICRVEYRTDCEKGIDENVWTFLSSGLDIEYK